MLTFVSEAPLAGKDSACAERLACIAMNRMQANHWITMAQAEKINIMFTKCLCLDESFVLNIADKSVRIETRFF